MKSDEQKEAKDAKEPWVLRVKVLGKKHANSPKSLFGLKNTIALKTDEQSIINFSELLEDGFLSVALTEDQIDVLREIQDVDRFTITLVRVDPSLPSLPSVQNSDFPAG